MTQQLTFRDCYLSFLRPKAHSGHYGRVQEGLQGLQVVQQVRVNLRVPRSHVRTEQRVVLVRRQGLGHSGHPSHIFPDVEDVISQALFRSQPGNHRPERCEGESCAAPRAPRARTRCTGGRRALRASSLHQPYRFAPAVLASWV